MRLYTYFRSSASFRVRIACQLKDVAYEPAFVSLPRAEHKGSFSSVNPQSLVPAIDDAGFLLSQSLAIIEYLDKRFPTPALYPIGDAPRAVVQSMALLIACDIHPLNNLRVLNYLRNELALSQEAVEGWYRRWISEGFAALEQLTLRYGSQSYCFGGGVTVADLFLAPQMWNARRFQTNLSAFPRLVAIDEHLRGLPAFIKAAPESQPDTA